MTKTLITGATGFVGRHLLWDMLRASTASDRVFVLIRASSLKAATARLAKVLDDPVAGLTSDQKLRAVPLPGDITQDRLGMSPVEERAFWPGVTHVVHCAATVQFNLPLETARAINVAGTRRLLDAAALATNLHRFDYIGTAYVAGKRGGLIAEAELDISAGFHNAYEQTKAEAEALVRNRARELPVTIFRPSIVVGDSKTGITQNFNVLYWPLKVFARRLVVCIPADPKGLVDVVPIDYLRDAISHIRATRLPGGEVFHISCGAGNVVTIDQLARLAATQLGVWRPPYVSAALIYPILRPLLKRVLKGAARHVVQTGDQYLPYLSHRAIFDTTNTQNALHGSGIAPPSPLEYFSRLIDYGLATDWGNRPPQTTSVAVHPDGALAARPDRTLDA